MGQLSFHVVLVRLTNLRAQHSLICRALEALQHTPEQLLTFSELAALFARLQIRISRAHSVFHSCRDDVYQAHLIIDSACEFVILSDLIMQEMIL